MVIAFLIFHVSGFEPVSSVPLKHFFYQWSCTPLSYCLHFITLFKVLVNVAKVEKTVTAKDFAVVGVLSLVCVGCVFVGGKFFSFIYCDTKD